MLIKNPKTIKQITFGEAHGLIIPPRLSPRRIIKLVPMIAIVPSQSIICAPRYRLVRGLWTFRQRQSTRNETPQAGRFIHQFHRHETYSVSAPPSGGPTPLARLHTTPVRPRKKPRSLWDFNSHRTIISTKHTSC
jgi:hypothetical protein